MNLESAIRLVTIEDILEAARETDENGIPWLLDITGRQTPRFRYVVVNGNRYPSKAFGFRCAQIAGKIDSTDNLITVDQAILPVVRLGFKEITGPIDFFGSSGGFEDQIKSYYLALARPEQSIFRFNVMSRFNGTCVVSGNGAATALQAAHIIPFAKKGVNLPENGLLLRADLHLLFDSGHLAIHPASLQAYFSSQCRNHYGDLHKSDIVKPPEIEFGEKFDQRWKDFEKTFGKQS